MAVIDLDKLSVEVVETTPEELYEAFDRACHELLGMTGAEFIALVKQGTPPDDPATVRLVLLAETFIERA